MRLTRPDRTIERRNETRDLVAPIIRALNRLRGVRVARNANLGPVVPWAQRMLDNARPVRAGLGAGSADIVGIVLGRAFALEVKLPSAPGLRAGALAPDQLRWLRAFRRFGGFAAVVYSGSEALEAVPRCR